MREKTKGIELWRLFLTCQKEILQKIEADLRESNCISLSWYDVLIVLERSPEKTLPLKSVLAELVLTKSAVSKLIDRMEEAKVIEREKNLNDGRSLDLTITKKGSDSVKEAWLVYKKGIQAYFLNSLDEKEIQVFYQILLSLRKGGATF